MCAAWYARSPEVQCARALLLLLVLGALPRAAFGEGSGSALLGWAAHENLTNGYSPWTEYGLALEHRTAARQFFGARWRETERFDERDREAGLALHQPLGSGWSVSFDAAASGTHNVLPQRALLGQIEKQLGAGWGVHLGFRRSQYPTEYVDLRMLTVERYFGNHRAAYTFYSGRLEQGNSAPTHRLQWSYYFSDRSSAGISGAYGREIATVGPGTLLSTDVRNLTLFAQVWLHGNWAVSAEASTQQQGDLYRRNGIRLGLRYGF